MRDSKVIESLDSLWFFSNVITSNSQKPGRAFVHDTATLLEVSPPKSIDPVIQPDQSPNPECRKCREFSAEVKSLQTVETPSPMMHIDGQEATIETSSSKKEGTKKKRRSRRKVLGEIDMGLGVDYYRNGGNFMEETVQTCDFGNPMLLMSKVKMPSLNDGLAMKQHLKDWAYAVACTVR